MATAAPRELKIGTIIDKTLAVLERCAKPVLVYFIVLTVANCVLSYFTLGIIAALPILATSLLKIIVGVFAAFLLLNTMVRQTGLSARGDNEVFLPYFGLSILYTLAVMFGLILLVIPGLFLMARWSISQPLIVARGGGIMAAFGESWEKTRGQEFQILAAIFALFILFVVIIVGCSMVFAKDSVTGMIISQLATSGMSATSLAMGVALYGLIVGTPKEAAATFE